MRSVTNVENDLGRLAEAAHVLSRTLRRLAEQHVGLEPLPASEYDVLQFVVMHPGSSVSGVARALRLQTSNVSTTVRALVERNLLERTPDPADQRRSLLRATAQAQAHRVLLEQWRARALARAIGTLPPADAEAVLRAVPALDRLADALVLGEGEPGGGPPAAR
jgi:DNA-binding MarR family transcriptional regulator